MIHVYTFVNVILTLLVLLVLFQIIPTLLSANDWTQFGLGVGLSAIGLAFVWARGVEIYNDLTKGKE